MEKKRKRASFSPTITIEPDIYKDEAEEQKPQVSQMVEVVVEQKGSKKSDPPPKINIVLPKANSRHAVEIEDADDLEEETVRLVEKKLPVSRQVVETVEDEEEEKEEEVEVKTQVKHHQEVVVEEELSPEAEEESDSKEEDEEEDEDEKEEEEEKEEAKKEDEEEDVEEVEVVAEVKQSKKQTEAEKAAEKTEQKSAVAELFGKNSSQSMPEITIHKSTNNKSLIIWAITMVAIAIGVGGGLVLFTSYNSDAPKTTTTPTPTLTAKTVSTPAATPTPTKPAVSKADVSVQVQNGGGKVGAGSKMKAFLESAGYSVDDVGNAASYNYENTEIVVKPSVAELLPTLEKDLGDEYTLGTSKSTLPETSTYDVRVIVGKN